MLQHVMHYDVTLGPKDNMKKNINFMLLSHLLDIHTHFGPFAKYIMLCLYVIYDQMLFEVLKFMKSSTFTKIMNFKMPKQLYMGEARM